MCILEIGPELISSLQNSILSFVFGDFGGPRFAEFQQRVKIVGVYIKLETCSRLQKIIQNNYFDRSKIYFTKSQQKIRGKYKKTRITCLYHFPLPSVSCLRCQAVSNPHFPKLEAIKSISVPRLSGNYLNKRRFLDFFRSFGNS